MFQWFRRKARSRRGDPDAGDPWSTAAQLHAMRQRDPSAIYDLAFLPSPKEDLKRALHIAWGLATNKEQRIAIESSYLFLAQFQTGVGAHPISGDFLAAPTPEENTRVMNRWIPWASVCDEERWTLWIEWNRFKRGESAVTDGKMTPAAPEAPAADAEADESIAEDDADGRHAA
jgi:hypothetical protein